MMEGQELENFRKALLQVAAANLSRFGLGVSAFKLHVSAFGFDEVSAKEVEVELDYLKGKTYLDEIPKALSPENRLWRISAGGRDFLAMNAA
jgi:hypothetical protein